MQSVQPMPGGPDLPPNTVPVGEPRAPWTEPLDPLVADLLDRDLRLLVTYDPERSRAQRIAATWAKPYSASSKPSRQALALGKQPFDMDRVLKFAEKAALLCERTLVARASRLPQGPELVMVGVGQILEAAESCSATRHATHLSHHAGPAGSGRQTLTRCLWRAHSDARRIPCKSGAMSIVTTVEAVPSCCSRSMRPVDSENGEAKERIEAWATPPSLSDRGADEDGGSSTKLFVNSLHEARRLGLVEEVDDKLRLTLDARGGGKKGQGQRGLFPQLSMRRHYSIRHGLPKPNKPVHARLAWFLSSDPLRPMSFSEAPNFASRQKSAIMPKTELNSSITRTSYIGHATLDLRRSLAARCRGLVAPIPDPVNAIEVALAGNLR